MHAWVSSINNRLPRAHDDIACLKESKFALLEINVVRNESLNAFNCTSDLKLTLLKQFSDLLLCPLLESIQLVVKVCFSRSILSCIHSCLMNESLRTRYQSSIVK